MLGWHLVSRERTEDNTTTPGHHPNSTHHPSPPCRGGGSCPPCTSVWCLISPSQGVGFPCGRRKDGAMQGCPTGDGDVPPGWGCPTRDGDVPLGMGMSHQGWGRPLGRSFARLCVGQLHPEQRVQAWPPWALLWSHGPGHLGKGTDESDSGTVVHTSQAGAERALQTCGLHRAPSVIHEEQPGRCSGRRWGIESPARWWPGRSGGALASERRGDGPLCRAEAFRWASSKLLLPASLHSLDTNTVVQSSFGGPEKSSGKYSSHPARLRVPPLFTSTSG